MPWWGWVLVSVFGAWTAAWFALEARAGTLRSSLSGRWKDGCVKPFFERSIRADGSRKPIIPRPGDGEIDELEHQLEHKRCVLPVAQA